MNSIILFYTNIFNVPHCLTHRIILNLNIRSLLSSRKGLPISSITDIRVVTSFKNFVLKCLILFGMNIILAFSAFLAHDIFNLTYILATSGPTTIHCLSAPGLLVSPTVPPESLIAALFCSLVNCHS